MKAPLSKADVIKLAVRFIFICINFSYFVDTPLAPFIFDHINRHLISFIDFIKVFFSWVLFLRQKDKTKKTTKKLKKH